MQEGYTECVVLLVKRYPELLKYMLSLVMEEDMLEEKVRKKGLHNQIQAVCAHLQVGITAEVTIWAHLILSVSWCLEVSDGCSH